MVSQVGSANTAKIQNDEEKILQEIINKVKKFIKYLTNSLAQKNGKKIDNKKLPDKLSIIVSGDSVFESKLNQQDKLGSINPKHIKRIARAIKDPYNNSDEIKIKLGKQTLFHADKNQVFVDKLKLSKAPKQEQNLSLEQKMERLTKIVGQQQKQINDLEKKLENKLNFIALNTAKVKNKKLGNWISNFGSKLYAAWNNFKSAIKSFIQSSAQNVTEKVAAVSASFLEKPVDFMLNKYGREETPSILSFQGKRYSYSKNMKNGEISISSNSTKKNIVEQGHFTSKASPDDIKILRTLPEKVNSHVTQGKKTQKRGGGISLKL